ncbi:S8 family serine peptidase [Iningainema tapete]|uniref:S8 family serine peptidase n=1 Tax=Iningainema tapete BLCC-T55 TaxID=2748662 RepID=A0A8J7CGW1_9CYAN|nr:S8 family serine peptidase [Iningainema tapete]MBD2776910.1 S8 family serine peptidase [Iningainema tapete BLCC-T55]
MLDYSNLERQSNLITNLDYSLTGFSSGKGINDELLPIREFSGSSADYGDFLQISSFIDATDSPSSLEYSPLVATDPGSVFSTAYNIGNLTSLQTVTDFVSYYTDPIDIYSFYLPSYSSFNLSLNGLSADADVELLDAFGTRISLSDNSGNKYETIDGTLAAGTYYVRVYQYSTSSTTYRLGLSATPIVNNTRIVSGTLDANAFTFQSGFNLTVISGNGNVDFGTGARDVLNLSNINSSTVTFNSAANSLGGLPYNTGNGTRIFDAITLNDGSQILFEGIDQIQFADTTLNLSVIPNDPLFGRQWNLHMMGVHNAWRFTTGSNNVLLGIQDTGLAIDRFGYIHDDLRTATILPNNYIDESTSNVKPSHGTAVQGIIAAISNNGNGMSGINWNSPVFNIDALGGDTNDLTLAQATRELIAEANQNGQRLIINMSLGLTDFNTFGQTGFNPELERLVANNPNVLFLIAAGNAGVNRMIYPATLAGLYSNVIAVGASWGATDDYGYTTTPGQRIPYSQYGSGLTLMGPSEVVSTRAYRSSTGATVFDYYPSIDGFNGTSAATPNVTGVASLVLSANPNLSATQVKQILSQTAYDLGATGYDTVYGSGFVNADAAVRRALAIGSGAA